MLLEGPSSGPGVPKHAASRRREVRTTAILRGLAPNEAVEVALQCWEAGIDLVEVPVQSEDAWLALEQISDVAGERLVGAGTVVGRESAQRAMALGARVLISPGVDVAMIETGIEGGAALLPGVASASDVLEVVRQGVDVCKLFPASVLGVPYLTALRPVFPRMKFVATGGIGASNIEKFVEAGVNGVAIGGSIGAFLKDGEALACAQSIKDPWTIEV